MSEKDPAAAAGDGANTLSPMLLAVLANRFDGVVREMTNTMLRTGRSAVINSARDFSCGITTADNQLFATAEGLPAHTYGLNLQTAAMCAYHDDIAEGDAYLHNDPYSGNSHPADHTLIVPVFWAGRHVFNVCAKAHQADIGNSLPTTYHAAARDIYEEGALIFPAVRVQRDGRNVDDIIRMCQRRIRVADYWYGDFLAMLAAARTGEKRIHEVFAKYGPDTLARFVVEWFDYSEQRMRQAIRNLPAATVSRESAHDPLPPMMPDGIPVRVKVTVDPAAARIELDLTDNIDNMDNGLNLSEACSISNSVAGVFNCLPSDIPRNGGSYRCIEVKLREGAAIGIPRFPHSCSVATTNVSDRLLNTVQAALADLGEGYGLAEGGIGMGAGFCVISGRDARHGDHAYVNQLIIGNNGGPGGPHCDGWVTYGIPVVAGLMYRDSVEISELSYPIHYREIRLATDTTGAGRRRGAPGVHITYGPSHHPMTVVFAADGQANPARGVRGGGDGNVGAMFVVGHDGSRTRAPSVGQIVLERGMWLEGLETAGGGYGDPLQREPERVRDDVLEGYLGLARARADYGVVFDGSPDDDSLAVDGPATAALRAELARARGH
ncbi:MAG: hydantoinase B/oxoprolinase family protein [Gammaproteobacteria bacterium]|nr:hydantoinase B/oxoprolinase family protein [Gammaproteobacteria bacterium]